MGMSAKGMEIASYFLRDRIYSDKVLAVVREYICNAVDEHRKHKVDSPVVVKLIQDKTDGKWYWSVRDVAMGLDDNGVRNIFGMYFESTKSGDNDSIGGFGIGSKAGMSYSDTFYITTWNNGTKTEYICTLGAGSKGVPVGEIYDISTEPTTETGVEIRIEVNANDVSKFFETTRRFVEGFTDDVGLEFYSKDYNNNTDANSPITPLKPLLTVDLGNGFKLSKYEKVPHGHYHNTNSTLIRMGGVIYTARNFYNFNREISAEGYHTLDVPIGKLTIPISRENIEDTPANTKVYEDIQVVLRALQEEDRKKLTVPKFGTVLDDGTRGGYYGHKVASEWFNYQGSKIYPDTYNLINYISRSNYTTIPRSSNGKHIVYLIPNIKNRSGWHERLKLGLSGTTGYVGHYSTINDNDFQALIAKDGQGSLDLSDVVFICVKALKLPPLPKNPGGPQTQYLVYRQGYRQGSFTTEELDEFVIKTHGFKVDLDSDWWTSVKTIEELQRRTITTVKNCGTHQPIFTANSEKFVAAMHEMGWLNPNSPEYTDSIKRINEEMVKNERVRTAEPNLRNSYFDTDFHPNIIKAVKRNHDNIERLKRVRDEILKEDSTRARILRKLTRLGSYDGARKISRGDLRKILSLK